jgi:chemotaxis signal transduction protein
MVLAKPDRQCRVPERVPGGPPMPTGTTPEQPVELLLFRLAERGYASTRDAITEVVDVGGGQPPVPGLASSSLGALHAEERPVALVSLRLALGLPDAGAEGRILVVSTRSGPVGFLVDEVVGVTAVPAEALTTVSSRLSSRYISGKVEASGAVWSIIKWDAVRLPAGVRTR